LGLMMSEVLGVQGDKHTREVIATLAELRKRLIYQGDLSEESKALYQDIEQTLHQAIGEIYGWSTEETTKAKDNQSTGRS